MHYSDSSRKTLKDTRRDAKHGGLHSDNMIRQRHFRSDGRWSADSSDSDSTSARRSGSACKSRRHDASGSGSLAKMAARMLAKAEAMNSEALLKMQQSLSDVRDRKRGHNLWHADVQQQKPTSKTYHVLSQPVRLELNKYFFDVQTAPSRKEREKLLHFLLTFDSDVSMKKLTRWFQNKRQYMKTHSSLTDALSDHSQSD